MLGRPTDQYSRTNCVPQVSPKTSKAPTAKAGALDNQILFPAFTFFHGQREGAEEQRPGG